MVAPIVVAAGKVAARALAGKAASKASSFVSSPAGKAVIAALVLLTILAPVLLVVGVTAIAGGLVSVPGGADAVGHTRCLTNTSPDTGTGVTFQTLSAEQVANATTIIGVAKTAVLIPGSQLIDPAVRQHAAAIAIATSMQESKLTNLPGGDRDSAGLFQQRPSMSWGTIAQVTDPVYAATAFFYGAGTNRGLVDVNGWQNLAVTVAAQAVQRSGFPDAYAKWESLATATVSALWDGAPPVPVAAALDRPALGTSGLPSTNLTIPAGDISCTSPYTPSTGYQQPGEWGGYSNGDIPFGALCVVPWASSFYLRCDAVTALAALNEAYKADHGGRPLGIVSAYRDREAQVAVKNEACAAGHCNTAATPGKSNHGFGLAVDLANFGSLGDYSSDNYAWMKAHAAAYGWIHIPAMEPGGSGPFEPWHWEFWGVAPTSTSGA